MHLLRPDFLEQIEAFGFGEDRAHPEQGDGIGQQRNDPRQPQTVEEKLTQAELVLFVGLRGFDPAAGLPQELLTHARTERDRAEENLMGAGRKRKFPRTRTLLPTPRAQGIRIGDAEPV